MKDISLFIIEKLSLNKDTKISDKSDVCFNTSEEVANFFKDTVAGVKVKKVNDHGYSSATFKNWGDHGANAYCKEVYVIQFPNDYKIRVGMCYSKNKINDRRNWPDKDPDYFTGINEGDICFQTGYKSSWESDALTGYEPGSNLLTYVDKSYVGHYLKKIFKDYELL